MYRSYGRDSTRKCCGNAAQNVFLHSVRMDDFDTLRQYKPFQCQDNSESVGNCFVENVNSNTGGTQFFFKHAIIE